MRRVAVLLVLLLLRVMTLVVIVVTVVIVPIPGAVASTAAAARGSCVTVEPSLLKLLHGAEALRGVGGLVFGWQWACEVFCARLVRKGWAVPWQCVGSAWEGHLPSPYW